MAITPDTLEREFSLPTAATRLAFLSRRDNGDTVLGAVVEHDDGWGAIGAAETSLDVEESLELLALGEVVARKAHDSRLVGIRAALRAGADWPTIAGALGVTPAEAWDAYQSSVQELVDQQGLDADGAATARELAGSRPR